MEKKFYDTDISSSCYKTFFFVFHEEAKMSLSVSPWQAWSNVSVQGCALGLTNNGKNTLAYLA
jgi:hypothetical protein